MSASYGTRKRCDGSTGAWWRVGVGVASACWVRGGGGGRQLYSGCSCSQLHVGSHDANISLFVGVVTPTPTLYE